MVINIDKVYGTRAFDVRIKKLREALYFLKANHPSFKNIVISEENFLAIHKTIQEVSEKHIDGKVCTTIETSVVNNRSIEGSAVEFLLDVGQREPVEEEVAQSSLQSSLSVDARGTLKELRNSIFDLFKSISRRGSQLYSSGSNLDGWEL